MKFINVNKKVMIYHSFYPEAAQNFSQLQQHAAPFSDSVSQDAPDALPA